MPSASSFGYGHIVASGGSQNLSASFQTKPIAIGGAQGIGVEIHVENSSPNDAVGTWAVQISNSGENWTSVDLSGGGSTVALASGTDLDEFLDLTDLNAAFGRIVYTRTSGNGIADVYVHVRR